MTSSRQMTPDEPSAFRASDETGGPRPAAAAEQDLCPHCLEPLARGEHFCRRCGAPLTFFAATDPLSRVLSQGHGFGNAARNPRRLSVLIGMWLIFGPVIVVVLLATADGVVEAPADTRDAVPVVLGAAFNLAVVALFATILGKTTTNFLRIRAAASDDSTAADDAATYDNTADEASDENVADEHRSGGE